MIACTTGSEALLWDLGEAFKTCGHCANRTRGKFDVPDADRECCSAGLPVLCHWGTRIKHSLCLDPCVSVFLSSPCGLKQKAFVPCLPPPSRKGGNNHLFARHSSGTDRPNVRKLFWSLTFPGKRGLASAVSMLMASPILSLPTKDVVPTCFTSSRFAKQTESKQILC